MLNAGETAVNEDAQVTTKTWSYDGLNRLVKETFDGVDGSGDELKYTDTFEYDLSSNRVEVNHDNRTTSGPNVIANPDSVTTSTYDGNDRLLSETKDVSGTATGDRHTVYGYGPTDQTSKTVHEEKRRRYFFPIAYSASLVMT